MERRAKLFVASLVLFAAFALIGYYAVKSSAYMDVSQVLKLNHEAKVTVRGYLENLQYDAANRKLYLLLSGKNGAKLLAVADAKIIEDRYGPIQYLKWDRDNVVLEGIYDPNNKVLIVTNVLQGCHSNYGQPAART
jgi:hypothetical protein